MILDRVGRSHNSIKKVRVRVFSKKRVKPVIEMLK
jgi:hypothetical protein